MSEININIGVKGRYRIFKKRDGHITHDTGWFDNLITNQGMDYLTTGVLYLNACQVGTSSTAPQFTDVALGSRIAGITGFTLETTIDSTNRYAIHKKTYTFFAGTATGNISEVGVGTAGTGNVLFSRALILDSFGVPTTITVLADEDLVVIYELYIKQPTGDFTATVSSKSVTVRACLVNSNYTPRGWGMWGSQGEQFVATASNTTHAMYFRRYRLNYRRANRHSAICDRPQHHHRGIHPRKLDKSRAACDGSRLTRTALGSAPAGDSGLLSGRRNSIRASQRPARNPCASKCA